MDNGALKKQMVFASLGMALLAAACSGDDGVSVTTPGASATSPTSIVANSEAYCGSLEDMFLAQPAGGFIGDEFGEAMNAYADKIEAAAAVSPADQADALSDLALFVRDSAADPNADGIAERAFALVGPMLRVQNYAVDECGLDPDVLAAGSGGNEPPPPIRSDLTEIDADVLDALNALVPAGVDLAFESFITTDDDDYPVLAAAPVGWEASDFIGTSFEPGEELGFFTQMDVGAHCDGICAPRNWGNLMDDAEFGPFAGLADAIEILRDEKLDGPNGRLVAYREDTTITPVKIVAARWDDRADRYFRCEAKLDEDDVDLWEVFVAACRAAIPLWIPLQ